MTTPPAEPAPKRGRRRIWPPEASRLVQQKKHPSALCAELAALTGNDERACWLFMKKHGIERPGSKRRKLFDPRTVDNLIDCASENGVQAAAIRFGYEPKTLYNLLYRQERTKLSRDALSLRVVCNQLRVKYRKGMEWIEQGLLRATRCESTTGNVSYVIEFDVLQKFCKEHRNLLVTRRCSPSRIHLSSRGRKRAHVAWTYAPIRAQEHCREGAQWNRI